MVIIIIVIVSIVAFIYLCKEGMHNSLAFFINVIFFPNICFQESHYFPHSFSNILCRSGGGTLHKKNNVQVSDFCYTGACISFEIFNKGISSEFYY